MKRLVLLVALVFALPVAAQDYPSKSIKMITAFGPGTATDIVARIIGAEIATQTGQTVVIENKPGAEGQIAAQAASVAPPDGYTLFFTTQTTQALNPHVYKSLAYDPVKDFAPIALLGTIPQMIIVSPKLKASTLKEFIAYARTNPGKVNIGDSGVGTTLHILAAQIATVTGIEIQHVHYRGAAGSVADALGGQIEAALTGFTPSFATAKVLGVTWSERLNVLPNVPTFREQGVDIISGLSLTLVAPAKTPPAIVAQLNAATNDFLKSERGRGFEKNYALQIAGGTPEIARDFLAGETARLEPVIRKAKITAD